ncbi:MAG: biosynthetic peptidoglycan transglycosylase [Succiniclasticum sp.]|nr:biosynthetic peptidoglycan transglycosylase [Succiniclasticum sp.]MDY6346155.1 biosynthetic peptidoglycan transglycosylase [Succiniclasticum sp.]
MQHRRGSRLPKILFLLVLLAAGYLGWTILAPRQPDRSALPDRGAVTETGAPERGTMPAPDKGAAVKKETSPDQEGTGWKDQAGNFLFRARDAAENAGRLARRSTDATGKLAGAAKENGSSLLFSVSSLWHAREIIAARQSDPDWVPYQQIPPQTRQALLAIEDHGFYEHGPFDVTGMFRAALVNLTAGEILQGGSTLTQQMVKNVFLSSEQTMARKFQEAALSMYVEHYYSKNEILELYFNTTYFGNGYYGLRAAAKGYLGKEPGQLNLPESAMLAALPNAPSQLNPFENPLGCGRRAVLVLKEMKRYRYIGTIDMDNAMEQGVTLRNGRRLVLQ